MGRTAALMVIALAVVASSSPSTGAWVCEREIRSVFSRVEHAGPYQLRRTNPIGNVVIFDVVPPDRIKLARTSGGATWPDVIFIGKKSWAIVNGAAIKDVSPLMSPSGLLRDTLWLYSLASIGGMELPSIAAQCLGAASVSGGSVLKYAYRAREEFDGKISQRSVEVHVDPGTMLPIRVEVIVSDGKYIDEWRFDASIRVELPSASDKIP